MDNYEELYKHSKYVFDEENSRFSRIEDKAGRFVTVTTSLLAVYALTGRLMFGSLLPVEGFSDGVQLVLTALVLLSLLVSWGFAFRAMQIQGIQKAPLNDSMLEFAKSNNVQTFYYAMSKAYGKHLLHNRKINDAKANNIKKSFWSIVSTVAFFTIYIVCAAIIAGTSNSEINVSNQVSTPKSNIVKPQHQTQKETAIMSGTDNGDKPNSTPETTSQSQQETPEKPDFDVVAPEFDMITESFDPSKAPNPGKLKD